MRPKLHHLVYALAVATLTSPGCGGSSGDTPTDAFIAFGSSSSTVTLAWTPAAGASSLVLERKLGAEPFATLATLRAGEVGYLDKGLTKQPYTYRLRTLRGADATVSAERTATPTDDEALVAPDDVPVGAPVMQAIGAGGGSIVAANGMVTVIIPAGAVPDGTLFTVQQIANPMADETGAPERTGTGVSVSADVTLMQPIRIQYSVGEDDAESPGNLVVAHKLADGTWVTGPSTLDSAALTVTFTLAPPGQQAKMLGHTHQAATARTSSSTFLLRSIIIRPYNPTVRPNEKVEFKAYGLFSDFTCDIGSGQIGCAMLAAVFNPSEFLRPLAPRPRALPNRAPGYERDWTVGWTPPGSDPQIVIGGNDKLGHVVPNLAGSGAAYTAPPVALMPNQIYLRMTSAMGTGTARRFSEPGLSIISISDGVGWRGTVSCVATGNRTTVAGGVTTTKTEDSTLMVTGNHEATTPGLPPSGVMKITQLWASYMRRETQDQEVGTLTCPVHRRTVINESVTLQRPAPGDAFNFSVIEGGTTASYSWSIFVFDAGTGVGSVMTTYTAGGDPTVCGPAPPNTSGPVDARNTWFCEKPVTIFDGGPVITDMPPPEVDAGGDPPLTLTKSWRFDRL